jgi:hypothetical protein
MMKETRHVRVLSGLVKASRLIVPGAAKYSATA